MDRIGDWMETYTGRKFWPLDPRPEDVVIEDIAHALSLLCRFGGHCKHFYSVAQHSVLVCDLISASHPEYGFEALMHDAAEAYVGDVIRPLKRSDPKFGDAEKKVQEVIGSVFGFNHVMSDVVKWADNVMLRNEHRQIMTGTNQWPSCDQADGPVVVVNKMSPGLAESEFMARFRRYKS